MINFLAKTIIISGAIVAVPIVFLNQMKKWIKDTDKDKEFIEIMNR